MRHRLLVIEGSLQPLRGSVYSIQSLHYMDATPRNHERRRGHQCGQSSWNGSAGERTICCGKTDSRGSSKSGSGHSPAPISAGCSRSALSAAESVPAVASAVSTKAPCHTEPAARNPRPASIGGICSDCKSKSASGTNGSSTGRVASGTALRLLRVGPMSKTCSALRCHCSSHQGIGLAASRWSPAVTAWLQDAGRKHWLVQIWSESKSEEDSPESYNNSG